MAEPTTCPVAALGRQVATLIKAYAANEEVEFTLRHGPERFRLDWLGEHIQDHRFAIEACAANTLASSAEGALFQVVMAYHEAYSLCDMAHSRGAGAAEKTMRRVAGLLFSVATVLEQMGGRPADATVMNYYMNRRYDPQRLVGGGEIPLY